MKKLFVIILALAVAASLIAGCGKKKTTEVVNTPEGKVKVTRTNGGDEGEVQIESKEGKATIKSKREVSEAEVGIPIYPGAKYEGGGSYEGESAESKGKIETYSFSTPDSFEKVEAFYKSKLSDSKNHFTASQGGQQTAMFMIGGQEKGSSVTITRNKTEKNTIISILKGQETKKK